MKSGDGYPRIIRSGSVAVKIYRNRHPRTATGWIFQVAWVGESGRKIFQFTNEDEAVEEARLKAAQLAAGKIEAADLTRSDRDELWAARKVCGDVPLLAAVQEWARARDLAKGNVLAAAEAWSARTGTNFEVISIEAAVAAFVQSKQRAGVDVGASYQRVLPTFTTAFGARSLHTISSRELTAWLEERHPNAVTRNTVRKRLVTLWRWARKQGYLPRDAISEAEQTETAQERPAQIGVIDGTTFAALLKYFHSNHPEYLGALSLAGFCGLRRAEIHGQTWDDIHLDRKFVRVTAAKRNTPASRLVPLSPSSVKWLQLCSGREGLVCENLAMDRIRDIGRAAEFTLPDNCFRHSFISHRVAETGNVAATALEAGNSAQIIFRHYRELFTKEEGAAWFKIRSSSKR
jgi:integrase